MHATACATRAAPTYTQKHVPMSPSAEYAQAGSDGSCMQQHHLPSTPAAAAETLPAAHPLVTFLADHQPSVVHHPPQQQPRRPTPPPATAAPTDSMRLTMPRGDSSALMPPNRPSLAASRAIATRCRPTSERAAIKLTTHLMETYSAINEQYYANKRRKLHEQQQKQAAASAAEVVAAAHASASSTSVPRTSPGSGVPLRQGETNDGWSDRDHNYIVTEHEYLSSRRYRVSHSIGKGSFGRVVKAWDTVSNTWVAIKIVKAKSAFFKQAQIEIRLLESVNRGVNAGSRQQTSGATDGTTQPASASSNTHGTTDTPNATATSEGDKWNIVCMLDHFMHHNHVCIVFELLSINLYELLRNCFPAADHEVMTERGFMGLEDVQAHFTRCETLGIACPRLDGRIEYHQIRATDLTVHDGRHRHIDMVDDDDHKRLSLSPTDNHRMHVRIASATNLPHAAYGIHTAASVLKAGSIAEDRQLVQFLAHCPSGVAGGAVPLASFLGLRTPDETAAFLELYGFTLAGDIGIDRQQLAQIISCTTTQRAYVESLLTRLHFAPHLAGDTLAEGWSCETLLDGEARYTIRTGALRTFWVAPNEPLYGCDDYDARDRREAASQCALPPSSRWWVVDQCNRDELRSVLRGAVAATANQTGIDSKEMQIHTSSALMRDAFVHLCINAGYSVYFRRVAADSSQPSFPLWSVCLSECATVASPVINPSKSCRARFETGRVWCVTVPTSEQLILFRRRTSDTDGCVAASSRAIVVGNTRFTGVSLNLISKFTTQLLMTLAYLTCKERGEERIIHCDLKPENILLRNPKKSTIKVIDLGSACFAHQKVYTYIQSRFYRAPEVILGINYNAAIDMWSLGCICYELSTGTPLFDGQDEHDQIIRQVDLLGIPPVTMIEQSKKGYKFFECVLSSPILRPLSSSWRLRDPALSTGSHSSAAASTYHKLIHAPSRSANYQPSLTPVEKLRRRLAPKYADEPLWHAFCDLILQMLAWDPKVRLKPAQALEHKFFVIQKQIVQEKLQQQQQQAEQLRVASSSSVQATSGPVAASADRCQPMETNTSKEVPATTVSEPVPASSVTSAAVVVATDDGGLAGPSRDRTQVADVPMETDDSEHEQKTASKSMSLPMNSPPTRKRPADNSPRSPAQGTPKTRAAASNATRPSAQPSPRTRWSKSLLQSSPLRSSHSSGEEDLAAIQLPQTADQSPSGKHVHRTLHMPPPAKANRSTAQSAHSLGAARVGPQQNALIFSTVCSAPAPTTGAASALHSPLAHGVLTRAQKSALTTPTLGPDAAAGGTSGAHLDRMLASDPLALHLDQPSKPIASASASPPSGPHAGATSTLPSLALFASPQTLRTRAGVTTRRRAAVIASESADSPSVTATDHAHTPRRTRGQTTSATAVRSESNPTDTPSSTRTRQK